MSQAPTARRSWAGERTVDAALAAIVVAVDLVGMVLATSGHDVASAPLSPLAIVISAIGGLVLLHRRRRPLLVLVLVGVAATVAAAAVSPGLLSQQSGATLAIGCYGIAAWSSHRRWCLAIVVALAALVVAGGVSDGSSVVEAGLAAGAAVGLPAALGHAARSRRLYVAAVERRLLDAEHERDRRARHAVIEERTHIARELHDVVAHHVSLIGVQAGAARTTLPADAVTTRAALAAIEDSSRAAVGEMRRLLDVLRDDRDTAAVPGTAPQPGLADLERLVAGFRAAGIDVDVVDERSVRALDPLLDVCCYRVVEEALTNVVRHSAARRARVLVTARPDVVRVAVSDPGPPSATAGDERRPGRGLVGMGERVHLFGGRLVTGPRPDGGFEVVAEVPRGSAPPPPPAALPPPPVTAAFPPPPVHPTPAGSAVRPGGPVVVAPER